MAKEKSRSATASIRGYLYQTVLAAQAWLDLEPDEVLVVEGDEDYDRILRGKRLNTQVKSRKQTVYSLETPTLRKSLKAFARTYAERGGNVRFAYVTTQSRNSSSAGIDHLACWAAGKDLSRVAEELQRISEDREWQIPWGDRGPDWRGFVQSVAFEFERSDLSAAREELQRRLRHHENMGDFSDVGALAHRMMDDLWNASAQDDANLRIRTSNDLNRLPPVSG